MSRFPRLYAAASLKPWASSTGKLSGARFPRLYAAASLKPGASLGKLARERRFSAALCRGLIEALWVRGPSFRCYHVFRGFMPRPH